MDINETLLALERLDQDADALRVRRASLPELAEREQCHTALEGLARDRAEADARRQPLDRDESRLEDEVSKLATRAQEVEDKLYSGAFTAARELEDLQTEMQSFQRRQAELEEEELAVMEQLEQIAGEVGELDSGGAELERRSVALDAAIEKARSEIDAELESLAKARAALTPALPDPLLGVYDRVRQQSRLRGRVAAHVENGICKGCHAALSVMDVSQLRREPPEVVIQCASCSRILLH